jgi:hypothetical protein
MSDQEGSASTCKSLCAKTAACAGFTHNFNTGVCSFKRELALSGEEPAYTSNSYGRKATYYLGCLDEDSGVSRIILPELQQTVEGCAAHALQSGNAYFGMQAPFKSTSTYFGQARCFFLNSVPADIYNTANNDECTVIDSNGFSLGGEDSLVFAVYATAPISEFLIKKVSLTSGDIDLPLVNSPFEYRIRRVDISGSLKIG